MRFASLAATSVGSPCSDALGLLGASALVVIFLVSIVQASACSGCGCRGGPGYRGPDGRCVGWASLGRTCGNPPTTRCSAEGPNAGAEAAAALGARKSQPNAR
jgi:hypothetical protein